MRKDEDKEEKREGADEGKGEVIGRAMTTAPAPPLLLHQPWWLVHMEEPIL